jgi:hypothetical protein
MDGDDEVHREEGNRQTPRIRDAFGSAAESHMDMRRRGVVSSPFLNVSLPSNQNRRAANALLACQPDASRPISRSEGSTPDTRSLDVRYGSV